MENKTRWNIIWKCEVKGKVFKLKSTVFLIPKEVENSITCWTF